MSNKKEIYQKISEELLTLIGGKENIQGVAHCATRLNCLS
ncbi:MAG: PTS transporter subunit EIIB [Turicibacter sanguinis]